MSNPQRFTIIYKIAKSKKMPFTVIYKTAKNYICPCSAQTVSRLCCKEQRTVYDHIAKSKEC